jgi:predicted nicotinamide N-methyase
MEDDKNKGLTAQQIKDSMALSGCEPPEKLNYDLTKEDKDLIRVDYRNSNYKLIEIPFPEVSPSPLIVKQDFTLGKGGIFWDGSYFISKYLLSNVFNNNSNIKNILELGAGTSLPSMISLLKGNFTVVTTDIPKLIPQINEIMELNKKNFNKQSKSIITELSWEKKEDIEKVQKLMDNKPFDLIIGSELVYLDDLFDDLINVIRTFSDENTYIILSYKIRLPSMVEDFTNKLKKYFEIIYIDYQLKNELYPNPEKLQLIQIKKIK